MLVLAFLTLWAGATDTNLSADISYDDAQLLPAALFVSSQGGLRGESIKGRTVRERSDHRGFATTANALDWDSQPAPLANMTAVKRARFSSPEAPQRSC